MSVTRKEFNDAIISENYSFVAECLLFSSYFYCLHAGIMYNLVPFEIGCTYLYNSIRIGNNKLINLFSKHSLIRDYVDWDTCIDLAFQTNIADVVNDVLVARFFTSIDEDYT